MLGQNCFSVKCYNKDLCNTIPAQPSIFNPQIAYVWSRNEMKKGKYIFGLQGDIAQVDSVITELKIKYSYPLEIRI